MVTAATTSVTEQARFIATRKALTPDRGGEASPREMGAAIAGCAGEFAAEGRAR
jgi:hypothetical protein